MLKNYVLATMFAMGVAGLPAMSHAQDYPTKPITIVVPFAPGGGNDLVARFTAQHLARQLGQPVVIDNRPGAGSEIGTDYVARAKPDGYTFLWACSDGITVLPAVKEKVRYKVPDDFEFVAHITLLPLVASVNAKLPIKSVSELIAYAKANPGRVRYGSSGVGSATHLTTALFGLTAGIKMTHVPYSGAGPSATGLATGEVDLAMVAPSTTKPYVDSGNIRPIALTGTEHNSLFPDVPTMAEADVPDVTGAVFYGLMAPAGTPKPMIARISKEIKVMVDKPEVADWLVKSGLSPNSYMDGDEFRQSAVKELALWIRTAKESGISIR
ncbi:MFS transporter [Betaproteobacteria bacterium]|nr:MFS transporter [Betaproteobacteria bacterium]